MSETAERWRLALAGAAALASDPAGLGGVVLRAGAGPIRDAWLAAFDALCPLPQIRLPANADADHLSGGLDLAATLRTGSAVARTGLLRRAAGGVLVVPMAERMAPGIAAQIAQAMDGPDAPVLILLDEGAEPDERAPESLVDRLALHVTLDGIPLGETRLTPEPALPGKPVADPLTALTGIAASFGIPSLRAPLQALHITEAIATADDSVVAERHLADAVALSLIPRARQMPAPAEDPDEAPPDPPDAPDPPDQQDQDTAPQGEQGKLEDRVLDAVAALLPDLMLADTGRQRGGAATGSGARRKSAMRGRPAGTEQGAPDGGRRLDLLATLRRAAPWQPIRRRQSGAAPGRVIVLPDDFRVKRFERPAESVMIFAVDASGSAAAARMAEAKGAVELMLSEAYRRREKVALIAFRGAEAQVLLEPTRSLLQAKRRLAVLPGGGGTPLAAALMRTGALARQIRQRGATPFAVLLTDGRGNIALDGQPGRAQAAEDQALAARGFAAEGITSVLIDTGNRPQKDAAELARRMGARYLPLPRADAHGISRAVRAATGT